MLLVKELRESQHLSTKYVAGVLQIPEMEYIRLENEEVLPMTLEIELCKIFGCTLEDLYTKEEETLPFSFNGLEITETDKKAIIRLRDFQRKLKK